MAFEIKSTQPAEKKENAKSGSHFFVQSEILIMFISEKQSTLNVLEKRALTSGEKLVNLCVPNIVSCKTACKTVRTRLTQLIKVALTGMVECEIAQKVSCLH